MMNVIGWHRELIWYDWLHAALLGARATQIKTAYAHTAGPLLAKCWPTKVCFRGFGSDFAAAAIVELGRRQS